MIDLKKMFVLVPTNVAFDGKTISESNPTKIYFDVKSNTIWVKGTQYGASAADVARITSLEETINGKAASEGVEAVEGLTSKVAALQTLLGANSLADDTDDVLTRIDALETLVGSEAADADAVINKLNEVYAWFNEVAETETGKALISNVAANTSAIGTASEKDEDGTVTKAATGLTGRIEALEAVNATRDLTTEDTAVAGQYVSAVSQNEDGTIEVSREDLPVKGVDTGSTNYLEVDTTANANTLKVKTTALGDVNLVQGEDGKWSAPTTAPASLTGLATAADVAAEIVANEQVVAAALNDHEDRIKTLETTDAVVTTVGPAEGQYVTVEDTAEEDSNDHDYKIGVTVSTVTRTQYATGETSADPALATTNGILTNAAVASLTGYADDAAQKAINEWDMWEDYSAPVTTD